MPHKVGHSRGKSESGARDGKSSDIRRKQEELHRLLIENVKEYAIFALDAEGRILTWNPGTERLKGYSSAEVIGKHFSM